MDRKSIIVLVVCFAALLLWYPLVNKLYPPRPLPVVGTNSINTASTAPSILAGTNAEAPTRPLVEQAQTTSLAASTRTNDVPAEEQLLQVTNELAHYVFTSQGGGLKDVELLKYPEEVDRKSKRNLARRVATLNSSGPVPAFSFAGGLQGDNVFTLTAIPGGVRAEKVFSNGLAIVKEFHASTNYLLLVNLRLENRSAAPMQLASQEIILGTAAPMGPYDDGQAVGLTWYDGKDTHDAGASHFSAHGFMCMPRTPPTEYVGGQSNVVWAAVKNQFFALVAMPEIPGQSVTVQKLSLPRSSADKPENPVGYIAAMSYPGVVLAPGQAVERKVHAFTGPKEYQNLARIALRFNNNVDLLMGYGGFFGWFAKALLIAMNWLHDSLMFSYGWAIVAITVIIKTLFWPLTQASTRSMKRLQALQPQMKVIQEKYKEDPAKMNRKTMEFMKEHKVSPLGGCLPMVLQIPVFFGFYQMIQSAIELRGAQWLWVADLSKPDTLFFVSGFPFNLLPLLMGVTMLWQAKLTPPSPGMDPAQAKIMRYMPVMFMLFLYNFSAGLTLYWTVQNILTIIQTKLTRTNEPIVGPIPAAALTPQPKRKK